MLDKLRNITIYTLSLGLPLFMLPTVFADPFGLPKTLFLLTGVIILLLIWGVSVYQANTLHWRATPFDIPLLLLAVAYLLSTLLSATHNLAELTNPNGSGSLILLILLYYLIVQTAGAQPLKVSNLVTTGLVHAGLAISLWIIVNTIIELANSPAIGGFRFAGLFNLSPLGNLLSQTVFLLILVIYVGIRARPFLSGKRPAPTAKPYVIGGTLVFLFIGLVLSIYKLTLLQPFPLLPYQFGWAIGVEGLKNSPIFGSGPTSFATAFTRFKPPAINRGELWNVTFTFSSNLYLHLLTTVGLLGLAVYLFLLRRLWRQRAILTTKHQQPQHVGVLWLTMVSIGIIQLFVPFNLDLLFTQIAMLGALGVLVASPATQLRLVAVREGFVEVDTGEEQIIRSWKETEYD